MPSLDLHVLSTPPAFVLSQDQTLQQNLKSDPSNSQRNCQRNNSSPTPQASSNQTIFGTGLSKHPVEFSRNKHPRPTFGRGGSGHTTLAVLCHQIGCFRLAPRNGHARGHATRLGSRTTYGADHRTGRSLPSMADPSGSRGSRVSFREACERTRKRLPGRLAALAARPGRSRAITSPRAERKVRGPLGQGQIRSP